MNSSTATSSSPSQPVAQPTTPPPQPTSPAKPKSLLSTIVIVLLLAALGYLGYQNWQLQQEVNRFEAIIKVDNTPYDFPSPAPFPSANSTADWQTYTNSEYNYSIRYPSNLVVSENGMSRGNVQQATAVVLYENSENTFDSPRFAISVRSDPNTFENVVNKHYQKLTTNLLSENERQVASENVGYPVSENKIISPISQATFNGLTSFQYSIKGSTVDDGAAEYGVPEEEHKYIWFEAQQKFFLISFTNTNTMDQILSTFKFINTPDNDKEGVNSALSGYLNALTTGDCDLARSYLTTAASAEYQDVECNNTFTSWENLNEFHSSEEESQFYNQQQIIFDIKLYQANDQTGTQVRVDFQKENNQWKTSAWFMNRYD